jgi:hypothetical protein
MGIYTGNTTLPPTRPDDTRDNRVGTDSTASLAASFLLSAGRVTPTMSPRRGRWFVGGGR